MTRATRYGLVSAIAALAITAAGMARADEILIGISFDKMESFREAELKYLELAAKEMGVKIEFANAQEDAQRQASQVESLIAKGAKAIIAIPWDIEAAVTLAKDSIANGVPFVTLDQAPADLEAMTYHVGGDPCADGAAAGEFFAKAANGQPMKLLELQGGLSNDNGIRRSTCLNEVLKNHPNVQIVAQVETNWHPEVALTATENALQAHPDLGAVYSPWNIGLQGVFSVLEKAGKLKQAGADGHIAIATIDGAPLGCKSVRDGYADLDLATPLPEMARRAVAAAIKAVKGEPIANRVEFLPGIAYTPADVDKMASEIWGCS